ncbi:toxin-antitoxin system YwqK family antitoxin [Catalinimonas alkaloidigena]|nr:toxin-antitoxin system YwqK family antitoxin [Catalinimonas alkaloidigena]
MKDSLMHGKCIEYYRDGTVKGESYYQDDTIQGEVILYHPDGSIKTRILYKDGKKNGQLTHYYSNGQVSETVLMVDGKRERQLTSYYENGSIHRISNYDHENRDGEEVEYYPDGTLALKREWVTVQKRYSDSLINLVNYEVEYDSLGNIISEMHHAEVELPDTVQLNDSLTIRVNFLKPHYQEAYIVVGDYDEQYHSKGTLELDTIQMVNNQATFQLKAHHLGENLKRAIICDYTKSILKDGGTNTTLTDYYFSFSFFVKSDTVI